ncbi:hypothetical protein V8E53_002587 [Lactarius tabidus]
MTGQELVFCICCNKHLPRKHEREHHCWAHNPLKTPTPHKRPRLAFRAAHTPRDKPKPAETQLTSTSKPLEHQDICAADSGPIPDMFSALDFEVLGPSTSTVTGENGHHLEGPPSGQEHDTDQILEACMSQRWHQCLNRSHPQLNEDPEQSEHGSGTGSDGEGSNVPLEDEVVGDDSDVVNWDLLDQQCGVSICDELGEDFEARYAKIGACTSIPESWYN